MNKQEGVTKLVTPSVFIAIISDSRDTVTDVKSSDQPTREYSGICH